MSEQIIAISQEKEKVIVKNNHSEIIDEIQHLLFGNRYFSLEDGKYSFVDYMEDLQEIMQNNEISFNKFEKGFLITFEDFNQLLQFLENRRINLYFENF